jgi:hypothetical protein
MNNQVIKISFDIACQIYNDKNKIIKLKNDLINSLTRSIQFSSRKNSQDNIFSDSLGLIYLIDNKINIINNNILNINLIVKLQNSKSNIQLEDIEEIIWCIMPSTYDQTGLLNFLKDGIFRTLNYSLKVLDIPSNIIYDLD